MDIENFLSMEIKNGQLLDVENIEKETEQTQEGETEETNENFLDKLINSLLKDERVADIVDTDNNGQLSSKEIKDFLGEIKDIDGNDKDISLNDILGSINQIKEGLEDKLSGIENEIQSEMPDLGSTDNSEEVNSTQTTRPTQPSQPTNIGRGNGGSVNTDTEVGGKDPSQMSLKELEVAVPKAETDLNEKQTKLNEAIDGSSPELQGLQTNIDTSYTSYMELLESVETEDKTFSKDIAAKKEEIDTQK